MSASVSASGQSVSTCRCHFLCVGDSESQLDTSSVFASLQAEVPSLKSIAWFCQDLGYSGLLQIPVGIDRLLLLWIFVKLPNIAHHSGTPGIPPKPGKTLDDSLFESPGRQHGIPAIVPSSQILGQIH